MILLILLVIDASNQKVKLYISLQAKFIGTSKISLQLIWLKYWRRIWVKQTHNLCIL